MNQTPHKRLIQGRVVSRSGDKSIVVLVVRKVVHPKYRKIVNRFKKYAVHDEGGRVKVGDEVVAIECKPISRTKAFSVKEIVSIGV